MSTFRFSCLVLATMFLAVLAVLATILVVNWYRHTQVWSVVTFEVPAGYRGTFSVVHDRLHGQKPVREPDVDGHPAFRFVVPPSGSLRSSTLKPFFHWHKTRAETSRGEQIPCEGTEAIQLRSLTNTNDQLEFLIGTVAEQRAWFSKPTKWHRIESSDARAEALRSP